jgi:hypothetical protein
MKDGGGDKSVTINRTDTRKRLPPGNDKPNVDFDSLRGLSDLGVDMSFLDSMGLFFYMFIFVFRFVNETVLLVLFLLLNKLNLLLIYFRTANLDFF